MRGHCVFAALGMVVLAMPALAQVTLPAGRTFPVRLEADDLAPLPKAAQVVGVAQAVSGSVAATPGSPFVVKGVVVTLSDTTGFARDEALEKAARQTLPGVLQALPMAPEKAAQIVQGLGSTLPFVSGYRVVQETVIPHYSLTVDLTFNEAMLHKNFGGAVPAAEAVSATVSEMLPGEALPAALPLNRWLVRLDNADPAAVSKLFETLNGTAQTHASYRLMTSAGAELVVDTPMAAGALQAMVGQDGTVSALRDAGGGTVMPLNGVY